MTEKVFQVLQDKEWKTINRGNTQFKRTWEAIDSGNPVRVLHPFNEKKGGRSFFVIKNAEALPEGIEARGLEVATA